MFPALFTTDLHLTDHPRDSYRFKVFPFLIDLIKTRNLKHCFILGDMTDKTDKHSAVLVNQLIDHLTELAKHCKVHILRGNHDCVDPTLPFFHFLQHIPGLNYITLPSKLLVENETKVLLLPHSRHPDEEWTGVIADGLLKSDIIFMHQTLNGSLTENGTRIDGMPFEFFNGFKEVYSGDVHVPQKLGNVMYVGSPYHVHFGDQFTPVVRIRHQDGHIESIPTNMPSRHMLNLLNVDEFDTRPVKAGDQVKISLHIKSTQWGEWDKLKQELQAKCVAAGVESCGIEPVVLDSLTVKADSPTFLVGQQAPKQVLERFLSAKYPNLGKAYIQAGEALLKQVDGI